MPRTEKLTAETTALGLSLMILVLVVLGVVSCGDEDIFFPGDLAATSTAAPTNTSTPDNS